MDDSTADLVGFSACFRGFRFAGSIETQQRGPAPRPASYASSGCCVSRAWRGCCGPCRSCLDDFDLDLEETSKHPGNTILPSGYVKIAIENGPFIIVDFPIKNGDFP